MSEPPDGSQGPSARAAHLTGRAPRAARDLPDELSARTLLSHGQKIAGAAILGAAVVLVGIPPVTGHGPSLRNLAVSAIAVATTAYVPVIAFRLALLLSAPFAPVLRVTPAALRAVRR